MERMGDILARTATRRYGGLHGTSRAPKARIRGATPGTRSETERNRTPAAPATGERAEEGRPLAADTLGNDQVLELPARSRMARPKLAATQDRRSPPVEVATKLGKLTRVGEIAETLVARRRPPSSAARPPVTGEEAVASAPRQRNRERRKDEPTVCAVCGGAGYVRMDVPLGDPSFGKPVPCQCRVREWEERRRLDLRRISSLDPFKDKTFDTFNQKILGVQEAYEAARRYAEDPHGWLVLRGGYGCGKTHLAAAIANAHLAAGDHVFFSIVPDLLDHLRAAFAPSSEIRYDEMFERVREAGLLVLDDLGAENGTAWATEKLFQIINYRYNFRMPTVITTNNRLLSHLDERLASRLSDIGLVHTIVLEAQDYRKRHTNGAATVARSTPGTQRGHAHA